MVVVKCGLVVSLVCLVSGFEVGFVGFKFGGFV